MREHAVHDQRLGVHHRRLVLVDLDAALEKQRVMRAARELHGLGVGDVSLHQHPHPNTALPRLAEAPSRRLVGDEIRRLDVDRSAGRRPATGGRAASSRWCRPPASSRRRSSVAGPSGSLSCVSTSGSTTPPVSIQFSLNAASMLIAAGPRTSTCVSRHCFSFSVSLAHWSAMPMPPTNADVAVDDQRLAVGAVVRLFKRQAADRIEPADADSPPLRDAARAPDRSCAPTESNTRRTSTPRLRRRLERRGEAPGDLCLPS